MKRTEELRLILLGLQVELSRVNSNIAAIKYHMAGEEGYGHLVNWATNSQAASERAVMVYKGMAPEEAWKKQQCH